MGVVVNPRQEPGEEEHGCDADKLEDRHLGILEHVPLVDDLDHAASQEAKMCSGRSDLGAVRNEDGGREVADHAGSHVDESDPCGASHLLEVPHQPVLEGDREGKV